MIGPLSPLVPLAALVLLALSAAGVLLPGALLLLRAEPRLVLPPPLRVLGAFAAGALLGYVTFWCYFAGRALGMAASAAVWAAAALALLRAAERRRLLRLLGDPDVRIPLLATLCGAFFYVNLYLGVLPDPTGPDWNWTRPAVAATALHPPDNAIPLVFARRLHDGEDLRARIFRDQASDRPPLQSGIALMAYPAWSLLGRLGDPEGVVHAGYQVLGVLLQSAWIAAAWALLRSLGLGPRAGGAVLVALVPSFFFVWNSVYVWPKLLAGSFVLGSYCLLLAQPGARIPAAQMGLAAGLAGLGLLSHGGVATSLLGFGILLLRPRWFPGAGNVLTGVLVVALLLAPWLAYQKLYDPPGNFIVKNHLAGVLDPLDGRGTLEAVRDAYAPLTLREWAALKWRKLRFVLGRDSEGPGFRDAFGALRALRHHQRLQLAPSIGLLHAGWIALLVGLWRAPPRFSATGRALGAGLLCTALWIALQMSWPIVQHASYATAMLLFVGLAAALVRMPAAGIPVLVAHVLLALGVALTYPVSRHYAPAALLAAALAYALLAWICLRERGDDPAPAS